MKTRISRPTLAVVASGGVSMATAEALARRLGLPCTSTPGSEHSHVLTWVDGKLGLGWNAPRAPSPVVVDLTSGATAHRWRSQATRDRGIARALGLRRGVATVLDATAGLGRDAFVLACCGAVVHAVERHPAIAALLEDGVARAQSDPPTAALLENRLTVVAADSQQVLARSERWHAVYLDPMFPARTKSAAVKKEMRLFAELVGDDLDQGALLATARARAAQRVVVKRPLLADPIAGQAPDAVVRGSRVRFDVYL